MKWGNYNLNWARPLKSILAVFDNKNLNFNFYHLKASNTSFIDKEFEDKKEYLKTLKVIIIFFINLVLSLIIFQEKNLLKRNWIEYLKKKFYC